MPALYSLGPTPNKRECTAARAVVAAPGPGGEVRGLTWDCYD